MGATEDNRVPPQDAGAAQSDTPATQRPDSPIQVGIPRPGPSFRGALKSRDFSLLWSGQFFSEIGNGLVQLALPFLVLTLTGSAFQLGFAYFIQFLPWLLFGLLGGVFVDRWDRRITLLTVDLIRAAAFIAVGVVYLADRELISVEYIYALIFLESTLQNFFNPARIALIPNLVKGEDLRAANSLMEVSRQVGFLIAPSTGVALAGIVGSGVIILADGVTFLISGLSVFLIKWRQPKRELEQVDGWLDRLRLVVRETSQGIRVIRTTRILLMTVLLGFTLNLAVAPIQGLMPLFVVEVKQQPQTYFGLLGAGFVSGLLVGSLTAPQTSRRLGLGRLAIGCVLVLGCVIIPAGYLPTLWIPVLALFVAGIAIGSLNVAQVNMLQTSTPDEERGRVSAAYYTATMGVRPFGFLVAGALAGPVGVQPLFVVLGLMVVAVGAYLARIPEVREHQ